MRPASCAALALLLLVAGSVLACSGCRSANAGVRGPRAAAPTPAAAAAAGDGVPADPDPSPPQRVVVRLLDDSPELRQAVDRVAADVGRWAEGWSLQVTHGVSGDGAPPPAADGDGAAGLPTTPSSDRDPHRRWRSWSTCCRSTVRRGASPKACRSSSPTAPWCSAAKRYPSPDAALALHLRDPGAVPRWLVVGHDPRPVARLVAERTFRTVGYPVDGWEEDTDYMLRQAGWQRRAGRWMANGGGLGVHDERDDFADQQRWFAGLRRVEAGPLTLLVAAPRTSAEGGAGAAAEVASPAASAGYGTPDAERLAGELAAAVTAMAPRLPIDPRTRLTVAVERDHVEQIRHTGAVGEVTAGGGVAGTADLHLVYHPRDLFAYRQAVARVLLDRAGLGASLPAYLRDGAALWLTDAGGHRRQPLDEGNGGESSPSATGRGAAATGAGAATTGDATTPGAAGAWYGLPWRSWLAPLAAADVLPTVDELLAEEEPGDGSELLWTPVAAALIDQLPGDTLSAKLAAADLHGAASTLLARLEADGARIRRREAGAAGDRDSLRPTASPLAAGFASAGAAGAAHAAEAGRTIAAPSARAVAAAVPATPASTPAAAAFPARDPLPPFLAGVSLAMLNDLAGGYQSPSVDRALLRLHDAVGANAVSLMPFAYQPDAGQPALRFLNRSPGSETDTAMIHAARRADARGFTVLWKPQIWVSGGGWPGDVAMTSEADWQALVPRLPALPGPPGGARPLERRRDPVGRRRARPHRGARGGLAPADRRRAPRLRRPADLLRQLVRRLRPGAVLG